MQRHYLHGPWQREIGGRQVDYVTVPGSYRPVGACTLGYDFASDWADAGDDTLFLVTEGVMAGASFTLNGQPVGEAGPWAPYRFPLPAGLLRADNTLTAEVRDIQEEFGTTPGRRYEAGLFRDIYLERRPAIQITNVAFRAVLNDACTAAEVTVQVENAGEGAGDVTAVLTERDGYRVATAVAPAGSPLTFSVLRPHLWSPATPCL